jgi:predicted transcriptional regulator
MAAITIHLHDDALERAKAIAESAGRSLDDVVQEIAVEGIDEKSRVLAGIRRGLADLEAGRVVDVAHVNARIDEVLRKLQG